MPISPPATAVSAIDIALVTAERSYNKEDFAPLADEPGVTLRPVRFPSDLGTPDAIILPGTPDVAADFDTHAASGMIDALLTHTQNQGWLIGICGGLHMLTRKLLDPQHRKYPFNEKKMIGLLELDTVYGGPNIFRKLRDVSAPGGLLLKGFETHQGICEGSEPILFRRADGSPIGYGHGRIWGTYLHRAFDSSPFRSHLLEAIRSGAAEL